MSDSSPPAPTPARRFWRLMAVVAGIAVLAVLAALAYMRATHTELRLHFVIALTLGIALTLLLAGALMGLLFFSARSGHDEAAFDRDDLDES